MKLNLKIIIFGIVLISFFSCKKETKVFSTEYLLGEWSLNYATELENGIEKKNPKILKPIRYVFNPNGTVFFEENNVGKVNWKILKEKKNTIEIGSEDVYFEHEIEIESDSKMIWRLKFENKILSSYFKRGLTE